MRIDIFCQVIDNYGDIGVCWRLAQQLSQQETIEKLRLFVDDLTAFSRIASKIQAQLPEQQLSNITICHWDLAATTTPATIVLEAFGCDLPFSYTQNMSGQTKIWINLEYLSAENWVADLHGAVSPQANGVAKYFFFPGFTTQTGGLLQPTTRPTPDANFWARLGINQPKTQATAFVFTYPGAPLDKLYKALAQDSVSWTVLIAATTPLPLLNLNDNVIIEALPYLEQIDFDTLLDYADLNVVRGEDSFIRAIWAAKPFIWQPYVQTDHAHLTKLDAWLAQTSFEPTIKHAMQAWNQDLIKTSELALLLRQRAFWQQQCTDYAADLAQHPDLTTQLLAFCSQMQQKALK